MISEGKITEEESLEWIEKYDGYAMEWDFKSPKVPIGNGHIDGACIYGETYAAGGFCSGVQYNSSSSPRPWAVWFTENDFTSWNDAIGFSNALDDTDNWRTESPDYADEWTSRRWMPKEARSAEYYNSEYRFQLGDTVKVYKYSNTFDHNHKLEFV